MKRQFKLLIMVIILIGISILGYWRYTKVNEKFQDFKLTEEKIQFNHKHTISVGDIEFKDVKVETKDKEILLSMGIKILKSSQFKDSYHKNMNSNFYARSNEQIINQTDEFRNSKGEHKGPDKDYFKKNKEYNGEVKFRILSLNPQGKNEIEIVYMDYDGHKVKKLYYPIKIENGKII